MLATIPDKKPTPAKWRQGEHIIVVGDTGSGKTYLISKLLDLRDYVIHVKTKPDDIRFPDTTRVRTYKGIMNLRLSRFILDPKPEPEWQRFHIARMIGLAWKQEGWTIAVDETYYWTSILKLDRQLNMLLTQGRSKKLTVVAGMQRPAWISRFALSQATHAFVFRCEGRDISTLAQALSPTIVKPVEELRGHDFVYFNRATRIVTKGNANRLSEVITRG